MADLTQYNIDWIRALGIDEIRALSDISEVGSYVSGHILIKQDDPSDYLYIILEGNVQVFRLAENGTEIDLAQLGPGSFLGEMAILDETKRSVCVRTLLPSKFLLISRTSFLQGIEKVPTLALKLLREMSSKLRKFDHKFIEEITRRNAELEAANLDLKKLDRMKSKFFSLASHELRTPLATMMMALPLIQKVVAETGNEIGQMLSKTMEQQFLRLNEIVNSVLKASESHDPEWEEKKTSERPNDLIITALGDLDHFFKCRKLDLTTNLDPANKTMVLYRGKFYQIVLNLLLNAIRFTPDSGKINILTKFTDQSFTLQVEDSGIGINESDIEHIFKPFYIAGNEMKHSSGTYQFMSGGIGLGLTIVKKFVNLHQGSINVESLKDVGSKFKITLPLQ